MACVGVDLGTASCRVAVLVGSEPTVLPVQQDPARIAQPSLLALVGLETVVGVAAEEALGRQSAPTNTIRNVKSLLGQTYSACRDRFVGAVELSKNPAGEGALIKANELTFTPEEVAAQLIAKLRCVAETHPVVGARVHEGAVIAVPSYFQAVQRQAVKNAGRIAGFERVHLINETTAVALTYAHLAPANSECERTAVIVDLGAGGSSVSVVAVQGRAVRVLASTAHRLPGGRDIDDSMIDHFTGLVPPPCGEDVLRCAWEDAKQYLTTSTPPDTVEVNAFIPGQELSFRTYASQQHFESCCTLLMSSLLSAFSSLLSAAKVDKAAVGDVILVGGCSRIPLLRKLVLKNFSHCLEVLMDVDNTVALGAALYAGTLSRDVPLELEEITPHAFYMQISDKSLLLVDRRTSLPCTQEFFIDNSIGASTLNFAVEQRNGIERKEVSKHQIHVSPQHEQVRVELTLNVDGIPVLSAPGELILDSKISCTLPEETLLSFCDGYSDERDRKDLERFCCELLVGDSLTAMSSGMALVQRKAGETIDWLHSNANITPSECKERKNLLQISLETTLDNETTSTNTCTAVTTYRPLLRGMGAAPRPRGRGRGLDMRNGLDGMMTVPSSVYDSPARSESPEPSIKLDDNDREMLKALMQGLLEIVHHTGPPQANLQTKACWTNPALVHVFDGCKDVALTCMADVTVRRVIEEVREAGRFALLVDSVVVPEGEFVSMVVRYLHDSGEVVERLVALMNARQVTGEDLYRRFTSLFDKHHVDWRPLLCGISTVNSRTKQEAYLELVYLLQRHACGRVPTVFNGSYRLCDVVAQAGECFDLTYYFFDVLGALQEFFAVPRRSEVFAKHCGVEEIPPNLFTSYSELIIFLHTNFKALTQSLSHLRTLDRGTVFIARKLLLFVGTEEFAVLLVLYASLFRSLRPLSTLLLYSGYEIPKPDDVETVISDIQQQERPFAHEVEERMQLKPKNPRRFDLVSLEGGVVGNCVNTVKSSLANNLKAMRDIDILCNALAIADEFYDSCLFDWVTGVDSHTLSLEMSDALNDFSMRHPISDFPRVSAIRKLAQLYGRNEFRMRYPHLYRGVQELLTLPVLPVKGGLPKLDLVRRSLMAASVSCFSDKEAALVLICALDLDLDTGAVPDPSDPLDYQLAVDHLVRRSEAVRSAVIQNP